MKIDAPYLLADRGYNTNEIIKKAERAGIQMVIPPKKNRKAQRQYDKNLVSFVTAVQIRCIALWTEIL